MIIIIDFLAIIFIIYDIITIYRLKQTVKLLEEEIKKEKENIEKLINDIEEI